MQKRSRLLPIWAIPLFLLLGYMLAFSCQRSESQARGGEFPAWFTPLSDWQPSTVQRAGNVHVITQDGRRSMDIASRLSRQPSRKTVVSVQPGDPQRSKAVIFPDGRATVWAFGRGDAEVLESIAWGLGTLEGQKSDGFFVFRRAAK